MNLTVPFHTSSNAGFELLVRLAVLGFLEPFGPERLSLGGSQHHKVIGWFVRRDKKMDHRGQVLLHGHWKRQVAVQSSSKVQHDGGIITADDSMKFYGSLYCCFPSILVNIGIRKSARMTSKLFVALPWSRALLVGLAAGFYHWENSSNMFKSYTR